MSRPNDDPIHIILVDTEGIGSIQQDQTYDAKIFSLAILLSSYFVYNSLSIIDERALDGLSLVVNLTKQISVKSNASGASGNKKGGRNSFGPKGASGASSSNGSSTGSAAAGRNSKGGASSSSSGNASTAAELADYFPSFLWLLRDFALDLVDERGDEITARQYLENALRERPEAAQQSKNAIRSSIKQLFRNRDCCTLVRPVVDEKQLRTIDSIPYGQLRAEFRTQSEELVAKILDEVRPTLFPLFWPSKHLFLRQVILTKCLLFYLLHYLLIPFNLNPLLNAPTLILKGSRQNRQRSTFARRFLRSTAEYLHRCHQFRCCCIHSKRMGECELVRQPTSDGRSLSRVDEWNFRSLQSQPSPGR